MELTYFVEKFYIWIKANVMREMAKWLPCYFVYHDGPAPDQSLDSKSHDGGKQEEGGDQDVEQRQSCEGLRGTGTSFIEEVMHHKRLRDRKSKRVLHISYFLLSGAEYMFGGGGSDDEYRRLTARTAAMGIAAFMKTEYGERKQFLLQPTPTTITWSDLSSTNVEFHNLNH